MTAGAQNDVQAAVNRLAGASPSPAPGPPAFEAVQGKLAPMVGQPLAGSGDEAHGVAWTLTYNSPGTRQFTSFESTQVGDAGRGGFRFLPGFPLPTIDAVNGTAPTPGSMAVGQSGPCVGVGFDAGSPPESVAAQLPVRAGPAGRVGLIVPGLGGDLEQWRTRARPVARVRGDGPLALAPVHDAEAAKNSLSWSSDPRRLSSKDPDGPVPAV